MEKLLRIILILFAFFGSPAAFAQLVMVRGKILTSDAKPAENVNISISANRSAISDKWGLYTISNVKPGTYTLKARAIGLIAITKTIIVSNTGLEVEDIVLNQNQAQLKEVTIMDSWAKLSTGESDYVNKMPLKNLENPQVYNTVTQNLLKQQLVFNAEDALKNVPGVSKLWDATFRAGTGGAFFASRGFVTQIKARNGLAGIVAANIDASNIERIEVIKGPSATLFGNAISSYGGLINRITKKPVKEFKVETEYAGGSFGLNRLSADVNTPVDSVGSLLFRANTAYNHQNSFQDYGWVKNYSFAPSFSYAASKRLQLNLDAEILNTQNSGGAQIINFLTPSLIKSTVLPKVVAGILAKTPAPQRAAYGVALTNALKSAPVSMQEAYGSNRADDLMLSYNRSYQSNDLQNKVNTTNFFAEAKYQLSGNWTSQSSLSRGYTASEGSLPYFYLIPNYVPTFIATASKGTPTVGAAGHDYMSRMVWRNASSESSVQVQQNFTGDFKITSMRNRIIAGLDYFNYKGDITYRRFEGSIFGLPFPDAFDTVRTAGYVANYDHLNRGKVDSAFAAGKNVSTFNNSQYSTYSAYVHDVLNITDQFLISAGLRLDHFHNKGTFDSKKNTYNGEYKQTALAPKFGLVYQPIKDKLSVFGNVQSSFTNVANAVSRAGKPFKPEQALQWEAGLKMNLLGDILTGSVSYYDIQVKNIVRPDTVDLNDPTRYSIQNGEQKSKGYEIELIALPVKGLSIIAGYSHNDSKLLKATVDVEGLRPTTAGPSELANFWASYQFDSYLLKGVSLGFGGNYAGEAYPVNNHSDGKFVLPSYTVVNSAISYQQRRFKVSAKLNNITNEHYWVGYNSFSPQMSRQFIGALSFKL